MCLGDVSGSWEGGSGASSWAQRQQRLPGGRGRPFSGLRGSRSGQGGGGRRRLPQPAWVDGRSTPGSRRPAPAAWICKPRCCPLAPMPATSPMARIISHWQVSRIGVLPPPGWVWKMGRFHLPSQTAWETLSYSSWTRSAVCFARRGRRDEGTPARAEGAGRNTDGTEAHIEITRVGDKA